MSLGGDHSRRGSPRRAGAGSPAGIGVPTLHHYGTPPAPHPRPARRWVRPSGPGQARPQTVRLGAGPGGPPGAGPRPFLDLDAVPFGRGVPTSRAPTAAPPPLPPRRARRLHAAAHPALTLDIHAGPAIAALLSPRPRCATARPAPGHAPQGSPAQEGTPRRSRAVATRAASAGQSPGASAGDVTAATRKLRGPPAPPPPLHSFRDEGGSPPPRCRSVVIISLGIASWLGFPFSGRSRQRMPFSTPPLYMAAPSPWTPSLLPGVTFLGHTVCICVCDCLSPPWR